MISIGDKMKKISKIKVKPKALKGLKIFGIVFCIFLGLLLFYLKEMRQLTTIGYSKESSRKILFTLKKDFVLSKGENKTLDAAFSSKNYQEENLEHYARIKYVNHKDLIHNINTLIKKGYSDQDINIIITHGSNESVQEFAKRDKIKYLEEFFSVDYAKLDYYDRYVAYSDDTGEDEETTVLYVNMDLDQEDYVNPHIVSKFSYDMLVNKHNQLTDKFEPDHLVSISEKYASEEGLKCNKEALDAFIRMSKKAEEEGLSIVINSAYRSYDDQVELSDLYLRDYGQSYVDKFVAKPGFSEHQTGLAFDIGSRSSNVFAASKEYQWMLEHSYEYGFVLRFTKPYEHITGFRSEPWHYRYVGIDLAKKLYDEDLTLEEYIAMEG